MAVIVQDLDNVLIDGVNAGAVTDVARNHKGAGILRDLRAALRAREQQQQQAHAAAVTEKQARIDELRAQVDALGGTVEAKRMARVRRRLELDAQVIAASAERAKLDAEDQRH